MEITTIVKGYKATDKNMRCRGYQYEVGVWHECEGELEICENGFHFCEQPSGPWSYYSDSGTRIWEVEAEGVLEAPWQAGADHKLVARRIKFVREVLIGGDRNTGYYNTGHCNTGYCNTGHCNTGNRNTGYYNTGHRNTGYYNTGHRNTGYYNTGDRNTGHRNTGDRNTGYYNTGDRNTGHCNTGNYNTTNFSAGYFCAKEPTVICFDVDTQLKRDVFAERFGSLASNLGEELMGEGKIDFDKYKELPGITERKLDALHKRMKKARKKTRS